MICAFCGNPVKRMSPRGNPYKYCSSDCDKAAMSLRMRGEYNRNPACECGCGAQVARPWNRYIHGHYKSRKLSLRDVGIIRDLLALKKSQHSIAKMFNVSQGTISGIKFGSLYSGRSVYGRSVVTAKELKNQKELWREIKCLRQGKKTLAEIKRLLRKPGVWQSQQKESQPDTTSPTS